MAADDLARWFLTSAERGNPDTGIDAHRGREAWTEGNEAVVIVHGSAYFARLCEVLAGTGRGDLVLFTDWRGDGDERLTGEPGSELGTVLAGVLERGGDVRGLVWRSHPDEARLSEQEAVHLAETVNRAGGEVLLDERVRRAGSHHQKLVLVRHPGTRRTTSPSPAASTCATAAATTSATAATPRPWRWTPATATRPRGTTSSSRCAGRPSAIWRTPSASGGTTPPPLDHRNPWRHWIARVAREPRRARPLPRAPPSRPPPGPTRSRSCAPTLPSGRPTPSPAGASAASPGPTARPSPGPGASS